MSSVSLNVMNRFLNYFLSVIGVVRIAIQTLYKKKDDILLLNHLPMNNILSMGVHTYNCDLLELSTIIVPLLNKRSNIN